VPLEQGLREAAYQLPPGAQEGPAETRSHGFAELAEMTRLSCPDRQVACRADGLGTQLGGVTEAMNPAPGDRDFSYSHKSDRNLDDEPRPRRALRS